MNEMSVQPTLRDVRNSLMILRTYKHTLQTRNCALVEAGRNTRLAVRPEIQPLLARCRRHQSHKMILEKN